MRQQYTPEQESLMEMAQRAQCQANIIELGVAEKLRQCQTEYCDADVTVCAEMLQHAIANRTIARAKMIEANKGAKIS